MNKLVSFDVVVALCVLLTLAISRYLRNRRLVGIQADRIGIAVCASIVLFAFIYNIANPSVSRIDRMYYQGQDQFYWTRMLTSQDKQKRQAAIEALVTILISNKSIARTLVIQDLATHASESELVTSALRTIANNDNEPLAVRNSAIHHLNKMNDN